MNFRKKESRNAENVTEPEVRAKTKKPKSEGYVMKKNGCMKFLRIALWCMLILLTLKGVRATLQRDKADVVEQMIRDFKSSYSTFTNQNEEVMSFAQNFAREYLTYTVRGEEDYKKRLKEYVAGNFFGSDAVLDFSASAEAVYVRAYRLEDYTDCQKDVYVQADVRYTKRVLENGTGYTDEVKEETLTLKIPVYCDGGKYVVECVPLVVSDSVLLEQYSPEKAYGSSLSETETASVRTSVENFLKAYCEQDASVISYYLDAAADRSAFQGLGGRVTFQGVSEFNCIQGTQDIICVVSYKVEDDGNGVQLLQRMNLTVGKSGGRYYIKSMDTRVGNLKTN